MGARNLALNCLSRRGLQTPRAGTPEKRPGGARRTSREKTKALRLWGFAALGPVGPLEPWGLRALRPWDGSGQKSKLQKLADGFQILDGFQMAYRVSERWLVTSETIAAAHWMLLDNRLQHVAHRAAASGTHPRGHEKGKESLFKCPRNRSHAMSHSENRRASL